MKPLLTIAPMLLVAVPSAAPAQGGMQAATTTAPEAHRVRFAAGGPVQVLGAGSTAGAFSDFTLCWDNSNTPPFVGSFQPGEEVVDWGVKACQGTGVVRAFRVAYETTALDVASGGPGAALSVAFYEGTNGSGVLGTETARYFLSGLPASSVAATASTHFVDVDLGDFPFCLDDGDIGFGFACEDGLTQPLMTVAPNSAIGTQNKLDLYSPAPASPATFQGSFDFGPTQPFASLYLQVFEDPGDILASSTLFNGSGINPLVYSEISKAVLGTTWLTRVDLSNYPDANFTAQVLSTQGGLSISTAFGELFVNLADPGAIATLSIGIHALDIPKDAFILGRTFHSQTAIFRPTATPILTNGIDVIPGF